MNESVYDYVFDHLFKNISRLIRYTLTIKRDMYHLGMIGMQTFLRIESRLILYTLTIKRDM